MLELLIQVDSFLGTHDWRVRLAPMIFNGQQVGWDYWAYKEGRWVKQTRGRKYLTGKSQDAAIANLLQCGEYAYDKRLVSVGEVKAAR